MDVNFLAVVGETSGESGVVGNVSTVGFFFCAGGGRERKV